MDMTDWAIPVIALIIFVYIYRNMTKSSRMMKKLVNNGVVAPAKIENMEQTGMMVNNNPMLMIWVTAYPQNQPAIQLVIEQVVSLISIPQVGSQVQVAYNPQNPKEAVILTREYADRLNQASNISSGSSAYGPGITKKISSGIARTSKTGLVFILGIAAIYTIAWRDQLINEVYKFLPPTMTSMRGQWVGTLNIKDSNGSNLKKAVVHVDFRMADAFFGWYEGDGEIVFAGENKPHHIKISEVEEGKDGKVHGQINSSGMGIFEGTKKEGNMDVTMDVLSMNLLTLKGSLHKGDEAEYQSLLKGLQGGK